jgi:hypothetical protein
MGGCRFRYEDLPPHMKSQVDAMMAESHQEPGIRSQVSAAGGDEASTGDSPLRRGREPNKTESAYRREVLARQAGVVAIHYEGLTFRMANGHRYTPDWVVVMEDGGIECHEVKGRRALHSQQRARLAFDQARVEFPWVKWVWAARREHGWSS